MLITLLVLVLAYVIGALFTNSDAISAEAVIHISGTVS